MLLNKCFMNSGEYFIEGMEVFFLLQKVKHNIITAYMFFGVMQNNNDLSGIFRLVILMRRNKILVKN